MKRILLILFLCLSEFLSAQELPNERGTSWKDNPANITEIFNAVTIDAYLKPGDQFADEALLLAMQSLPASGGKIIFDAKTYFFTKPIVLNSNMTLLGSGASKTKLVFQLEKAEDLIQAKGIPSTIKIKLTTQAVLHATSIQINNHQYKAGDWIAIVENDPSHITSDWAKESAQQIVQIASINNNILNLSRPLRLELKMSNNPYVYQIFPVSNIVLEKFSMLRKDETSSQTSNIGFDYVVNARINSIASDSCNFSHVALSHCSAVEIKGSHFSNAFKYGGNGQGYGIVLEFGTGDCLIEDNILRKLRHSLLLQAGSNGNVIAYNYSREPFWTETSFHESLAGDMVLHGNYPFLNLFEGNICQNIVIDDSHGINGHYNTFFRNRAEHFGLFMNSSPATNQQNFIANEITGTGAVKSGFFTVPLGNYLTAGNAHFEKNNLTLNKEIPVTSTPTTIKSYYLSEKPDWWDIEDPWPFCGERAGFNQFVNPAYFRYHYQAEKTRESNKATHSELTLSVSLLDDRRIVSWNSLADKETNNFEVYCEDQSGTIRTLLKMEINGIPTQSGYYFHDFRKEVSGKLSYWVKQTFSDETAIISKKQSIEIPATPSFELVYPNPVADKMTINKQGDFSIYSISGEHIIDFRASEMVNEITLSGLQRGIYYLVDLNGMRHKFVKQ